MKSCLQSIITLRSVQPEGRAGREAGVPGQVLMSSAHQGQDAALSIQHLNILLTVNSQVQALLLPPCWGFDNFLDMAKNWACHYSSLDSDADFHMGKAKYPEGDNWICTKLMEEAVGAELHR